jgi:hypothetical protein
MRTCPSCGFGNAESADLCQLCGRGLLAAAPPVAPSQAPEAAEAAPAPPMEAPSPAPPPPVAAANPPPFVAMPFPAAPPPPMQWAAASGGPPPPMMPPSPPPMSRQQKRGQFLLGILTGFIPLVLLLVGFGWGTVNSSSSSSLGFLIYGAIAAVITYVAALITMIVCLSIARVRFIGYGLLAAVASSPVIAPIACNIISNLSQSFR